MRSYLVRHPDASRIGPNSLTIQLSAALGQDVVIDDGWLNPAGMMEYRVNRADRDGEDLGLALGRAV